MHRRAPRVRWALAGCVLCGIGGRAGAQDTVGVSVRLTYDPRTRPTLVVPRVEGPAGDSVTAILRRDLDYGDRVQVAGAGFSDAVRAGGVPDYAAAARAGATGVVRATVAGGALRVALYDVSARRQTAAFDQALPAPALSPAWRR